VDNEKEIQFDHIEPFVKVEETSLDNIAPVCKNHMGNFFEKFESAGK